MKRLFVALDIPDATREQLARMQCRVPGARWVDQENFHLTLRFIGEVDGGRVLDLSEALLAVRAPAFALGLKGIGHFDRRGRVHALWVGVSAEPALLALQRKVEAAVTSTGIEAEGRKFKPHVTLARLKDAPLVDVAQFEQTHNLFRIEPFTVESFFLVESVLGRRGPSYRCELEVPLILAPSPMTPSVSDVTLAES